MKNRKNTKMHEKLDVKSAKNRGNKTLYAITLILMLTFAVLPLVIDQKSSVANAQAVSTVPSNMLQYEWPQMGADSAFTHFSAGPAPSSPDVLWQKTLGGAPMAFSGKLFTIEGKYIIAMDPFTGNTIYNVTVPNIENRTSSVSKIFKIDNNRMGVLVTSGATSSQTAVWVLRVLNTADGSLIWSDPNPKNCGNTAPDFNYVIEEKMAFVAVGNETGRGTQAARGYGKLQAWDLSDPTNPTLSWTYLSDGTISVSVYGDGKLFPNGGTPRQVCLDAKTGKVLWDTQLTGCPWYTGTYYEGKILRGLLDNTFVALEANTGKILWTNRPSAYGFWSSGSAAGYGMVYMANVDGYFYAFNATTGEIVWKYLGPGLMYPGYVQVADGKVYATTAQSSLSPLTPETSRPEYTCFDAYTGKVLWQVAEEFGSGPGDFACIAYGNFYAVNRMRVGTPPVTTLYCFGPPKDWSMFLANPAHTAIGYGGPVNEKISWTFKTNGVVMSSPAVADGKLYVGSFDKNWYCLDARNGSKIWNFTAGHYIRSSPAVVSGKMYTGADDGNVYCLDAETGKQLWKAPAPGSLLHVITGTTVEYRSSPTVAEGKVYVGSLDGKLYCLNAETGALLWAVQTTGAILSSPTYVAGDGLYFASLDGFVYKLNVANGNVLWNQSTPIGTNIQMMGTPAVGDGKVFIGSGSAGLNPARIGQFYCLNATNGTIIWTTNELPLSGAMEPIWSMVYLNGKVYTGDFFSFSCINASNGTKIWSTYLTREHYGSPAYADGKFYVPSDSFGVYIVNASSGTKTGFFGTGGQIWSSPAIYENKLYFGSNDWNVYCFEESSSGTTYYGAATKMPDPTPPPVLTPIPIVTAAPTVTPTPTLVPTPTPTQAPTPSPSPIPTVQPVTSLSLPYELAYAGVAAIAILAVAIIALAVFVLRKNR